MQADATPLFLLLLFSFIIIGLVCLVLVQRFALRRARLAARDSTARVERLTQEVDRYQRMEDEWLQREERFRTPLEQAEEYTIFLLSPVGRPTSWNSSV